MSTTESEQTTIDLEAQADLAAVIAAVKAGRKPDPEVARRVRERSDEITERLRREYGELEIGVPAIRELRGELPE